MMTLRTDHPWSIWAQSSGVEINGSEWSLGTSEGASMDLGQTVTGSRSSGPSLMLLMYNLNSFSNMINYKSANYRFICNKVIAYLRAGWVLCTVTGFDLCAPSTKGPEMRIASTLLGMEPPAVPSSVVSLSPHWEEAESSASPCCNCLGVTSLKSALDPSRMTSATTVMIPAVLGNGGGGAFCNSPRISHCLHTHMG